MRVDVTKAGKPVEHGKVNSYVSHGCRCDSCKAANTEYARETRRKRAESIWSNYWNVSHGKASTYTNHGCRCEACSEAMAEYSASAKAKRKNLLAESGVEHGRYGTYTNYGCRCAECSEAASTYYKERKNEEG